MEFTVTADTIIKLATLLTALGVIGGLVAAVVKFFARQKAQTEEMREIRHEQTIICYAVLACLKGLGELGCNGPVTEARKMLEKHLNKAAHGDEHTI